MGALRALLGLACVSLASAGCDRCGSSQVDPNDLHGVFDASARVDASAAPSASVAKATPSASAAASARPVAVRDPGDSGSCVEPAGAPDGAINRTAGRPACRGAEVLEWRDPSGAPRYACLYTPSGSADRGRLPLLVYFHGTGPGLDDPASVAKLTKLRDRQGSTDLTGEGRPGFSILGIQGRAIMGGKWGATFDVAHASDDNLDEAAADHFIDAVATRGIVDDKRIYAIGTGRGADMAITYAMLRADRVAAFGVYAPLVPPAKWSCSGPPPPGMVIYRACDAIAHCDDIEAWMLARDDARAETVRLRLGEADGEEPSCAVSNKCSKKKGEAHHLRWPKGREKDLLAFLAAHRLK
jgi:predicted esterase